MEPIPKRACGSIRLKHSANTMNLLTLTLALVAGSPAQLPNCGCTTSGPYTVYAPTAAPAPAVATPLPVDSPYSPQYLPVAPKPQSRQSVSSPYGSIRYDKSATPPAPVSVPRVLPALPVSRPVPLPTPPLRPRVLPPPVSLPLDDFIPVPRPSVPMSRFERALQFGRSSAIRTVSGPADWLSDRFADRTPEGN
jgi:hypothetical protein